MLSAFPDWYFSAWVRAFLFTQLAETPVYRAGLSCSWPRAFGASAITHPIVWFVFFHPDFTWSYEQRFVMAETFATVIEGLYFAVWLALHRKETEGKHVPWLRGMGWSLLANGTSVVLGQLSRSLFGYP